MTDHGAVEEGDDNALATVRAGEAEASLLARLSGALRVVRLHATDNVAAKQTQDELTDELARFLATHDRALILVGEGRRVFVNGRLTRAKRVGGEWLEELVAILGRAGADGLVLSGGFSLDAVKALVAAFRPPVGLPANAGPPERLAALRAALQAIPAPAHVEPLDAATAAAVAREEQEGYRTEAERAAFYVGRLVGLAEASRAAVAAGRSPDAMARFVRQTLMKIVDGLDRPTFEVRLVATTAGQTPGEPDATHAARVAILTMLLARSLGLDRGQVADLGLAALHHDAGRPGAPRAAGPDGRESRPSLEAHAAEGVRVALRGRNYAAAGLLRLVVAHEHHRPADGVPDDDYLRPPHAVSRLVAVADAFDRLEHGRPGRPGLAPWAALRALERATPDRAAVALLQGALGRWPRGSVLQLRSGEVVVVVANGERTGHRPLVRRVLLASGAPDEGQPVGSLPDPSVVAAELEEVDLDWRGVLLG